MTVKCMLLVVTAVLLSATAGAAQQPIRDPDRFSGFSFDALKPEFDNLAIPLRDGPASSVYIFVYGARRGCVGEVEARISRIRSYLTRKHGVEAGRIKISGGGYREEVDTEFFIVPPNTALPKAVPTVAPGEVMWLKANDPQCKKEAARIRRRRA